MCYTSGMVNDSRGLNYSLAEGLTDGVVKKATPDREASPDTHWEQAMKGDLNKQYRPDYVGDTYGAQRFTS